MGDNIETRRAVLWGRFTNTWINFRFIVRQRRLVDSRRFGSTYKTQLRVQMRAYMCRIVYKHISYIHNDMDSITRVCVYRHNNSVSNVALSAVTATCKADETRANQLSQLFSAQLRKLILETILKLLFHRDGCGAHRDPEPINVTTMFRRILWISGYGKDNDLLDI